MFPPAANVSKLPALKTLAPVREMFPVPAAAVVKVKLFAASILPAITKLELLVVRLTVASLADEALRVTVPLRVSVIDTSPVVLKVSELALVLIAVPAPMSPLPEVRLRAFVEIAAPSVLIAPLPVAVKVTDVALPPPIALIVSLTTTPPLPAALIKLTLLPCNGPLTVMSPARALVLVNSNVLPLDALRSMFCAKLAMNTEPMVELALKVAASTTRASPLAPMLPMVEVSESDGALIPPAN